MNVKESKETIRHNFDASCLPPRSPRHPAGDGIGGWVLDMKQKIPGNGGYVFDQMAQVFFGASQVPLAVVKIHRSRGDEFLESPSATEPAASRKRRREFGIGSQIRQVDVAGFGLLVPVEHGVDSFRELGAAALIDAAGIDPCEAQSSGSSQGAGLLDLAVALFGFGLRIPEVSKDDFFIFPRMRENCVSWYFRADELLAVPTSETSRSLIDMAFAARPRRQVAGDQKLATRNRRR